TSSTIAGRRRVPPAEVWDSGTSHEPTPDALSAPSSQDASDEPSRERLVDRGSPAGISTIPAIGDSSASALRRRPVPTRRIGSHGQRTAATPSWNHAGPFEGRHAVPEPPPTPTLE